MSTLSSGVSSAVGATRNSASATPDAFSELSSEEFVRIMFAELTNQDPLQPQDSGKLLGQISDLRSIQSDLSLTQRLDALVSQSEFTTAGGLIGQRVLGLTDRLERVEGTVQAVGKRDGEAVLILPGGVEVPFANVERILGQPVTPPAAGGRDSGTVTGNAAAGSPATGGATGGAGLAGPGTPAGSAAAKASDFADLESAR